MHHYIEYLGHIEKLQELLIARKTIDSALKITPLKTKTKLRFFWVVSEVYQRLFIDLASITAPLNKHLKV